MSRDDSAPTDAHQRAEARPASARGERTAALSKDRPRGLLRLVPGCLAISAKDDLLLVDPRSPPARSLRLPAERLGDSGLHEALAGNRVCRRHLAAFPEATSWFVPDTQQHNSHPMATALARLDAVTASLPEPFGVETTDAARSRSLFAARQVYAAAPQHWPALPATLTRLARVIERRLARTPSRRVLLRQDPDGLCALIDAEATVVAEHTPHQGAWLSSVSTAAGRCPPALGEAQIASPYDVAVVHAHDAPASLGSLRWALRYTRPQGDILVRTRFPWDGNIYAMAARCGLNPVCYMRDVEHSWLPTGHLIDGGADWIVFRRARQSNTSAPVAAPPPARRWQVSLEIGGLAPHGAPESMAEALFSWLTHLTPRPPQHASVNGQTICWLDAAGYGWVGQVFPQRGSLSVALTDYDAGLCYALLLACALGLGTPYMRIRPLRTKMTPAGHAFA